MTQPSIGRTIRIGVDLDGVVTDFCKGFSEVLHDLYGDRMPIIKDHYSVKAWDWTSWYPATHEEIRAAWEETGRREAFWESLECVDPIGYQNLLSNFNNPWNSRTNWEVYFLTNRTSRGTRYTLMHEACLWLEHRGWLRPQVLCTPHKGLTAMVMGFNHFIDDNPGNCIEVARISKGTKVYVRDWSYNRVLDLVEEDVTRVQDLSEFCERILRAEYINE